VRRVNVRGSSGSGKTTTSRRLAELIGVAHIELDELHHGPNWTEASAEELRANVEAAMDSAREGWVIDGNYGSKLGDLVLQHADTIVWLDLSLFVCLRRLWSRTWRRILHREELWNGNRESIRTAFFVRDSLFAWTIKRHRPARRLLAERIERTPHLHVVRLRSVGEVETWLRSLRDETEEVGG
jgi:adenylate kinase family enzyme